MAGATKKPRSSPAALSLVMRRDREDLLRELESHGREHDAALADRTQRLRNVEPETARAMAVLVRALRPQRILELGTSNGYSTIWLGDAAEETGGRVLSVERDGARGGEAALNVSRAGLDQTVELRLEDAAATLAAYPDEAAGLVFLDAERPAYVSYWPELARVLARPGLLLVDNAISHEEEMAAFRTLAEADERVATALIPIGAGVLAIARRGESAR